MPTIFIMSGLPFSGKSTLSKKIAEELGIPRISFDETWIQIEQQQGGIPGSEYINAQCEANARKFLAAGTSVVYDNLGHDFGQREKIRKLASEVNAASKVIYLDVDKDEVIERRRANLKLKTRAQVSDKNFDKALADFEPPNEKENALSYNPIQNIDIWIDTELKIFVPRLAESDRVALA